MARSGHRTARRICVAEMNRISITIRSPADRERVAELARTLAVGIRVEIKPERRSPEQNDLMWPLLRDIANQVDWYGQKLTDADWKDIFSASLKRARIVPNIDGDGFVQLGLHTSDLGKDDMSNLLELIRAFGAERNVRFFDDDSTSPESSPQVNAPAAETPPPSVAAGATNPDPSSGNRQADSTDAPAAVPHRQIPAAAGASYPEEASILPPDWRDTYIVQMTGPTTRAMSIQTRDHNAMQMIGPGVTPAEREWMRQVATLANRRDKGKLKAGEFESGLSKLRGVA